MEGTLDRVRASLAPYPDKRRFFDACVRSLVEGDAAVALEGSLARGAADACSDVDLRVVPAADAPADALLPPLLRAITEVGRPLAAYTGSHLALHALHIFVVAVDGSVQKLDLAIADVGPAPPGACILWDPAGRFAGRAADEAAPSFPAAHWREIHQKFCGWMWYTCSRVRRGEYLGAVASLEYTRQHALLPCLLEAEGRPQEGYRALERRLAAPVLQALARTCPARPEQDEILRALAAMAGLFDSAWARLEPRLAKDAGRAAMAGGTVTDMLRALPELRPFVER
jgi:hypothetical protein